MHFVQLHSDVSAGVVVEPLDLANSGLPLLKAVWCAFLGPVEV